MNQTIQLGERSFSSPVLDLELSVRASATISSSDSSNLPCDPGRLRELLCSGSVWVSQAPGLEMNLTIACTPGLHDLIGHFASQLGDAICEAKIWSELGLSALYQSCIQPPDQIPPEIELSFGIQRRLDSTEAAKKCRVPKVLRNLGDFLPPPRVPTAYITSVDILLGYNHKSHRDRTYAPSPTIPASPSEDPQSFEDILQLHEFEDLDSDQVYLSPGSILSATKSSDTIFDKSSREVDEGQKPDSSSPIGVVSSSDLSKLFQDGFRTLISGHVRRRRPDNSPRTESFQGLSRLAPAVFKPQYLEGMNQRARLIPSIAKCMAYWIKPGKNRSLQERLAYTREQNRTENRPSISTYNDDTKAYLKESLWRIAQKQLYNTPTPKQLNHERFFLRMEVDRQNKDEDMLLEESLEGCDAYDDYNNCGLGADPHLIAGDKPFELEVCDAGSCGSSIIFGNSQTEQPMEMLDDYSDARIDQGVAETWATVFAPRLSRSFLPGGFEIGDVDRLDGDMIMQGYAGEELLSQAPRWRTWTEILDEENSDCEMLLNETMEEHL